MQAGAKRRIWQCAAALAVLAGSAAFVLRFSYSTSFVWPGYYGYDSAIFQFIGRAWAGGTVPYAGLFDHKGPLIFFIDMLGWLIHGRAGILVVQTLSLAVTAWGLYRLGREYLPRPWALGAAGLALVYLARTFDEGNMTEEYSLPFLAVSLWLAARYCRRAQETGGAAPHPWRYAAVYGLSFGAILMLRVTSAVSLCCFVLVICIRLAAARQWKNLGANALGFAGGFAAATGPFAIYFAAKGALGEALYGTLWYNVFYATRFSIRDYYAGNPWAASTLRRVFLDFGAPLFLLAVLCLAALAQKPRSALAWGALLSAAGSMYLLFSNRPYVHYYMIVAPLLPLAACLTAELWRGRKGGRARRAAALCCAALCGVYVCSLAARLPRWGADSFMAKYPAEVQHYNTVARQMAQLIPENERDSVLAYNVDAQFYLAAELAPCQKYFIHQDWQAAADPAMQAEIARLFREAPPKWVAAGGVENAAVAALLEEKYTPASEFAGFEEYAGYTLYRLKDKR